MSSPDKLEKLYDALAAFTEAAQPHLFPSKQLPGKGFKAALRRVPSEFWLKFVGALCTAIGTLATAICAAYFGINAYQKAQIRNEKVTILERFLLHISPEVAQAAAKGKSDKASSGLDDYRRYVQGSERRYAALVALSQFDDDHDLLSQLAIQYPKEGLTLVTQMAKDRQSQVIQQIIDDQRTSMNILGEQVKNLHQLLERGQMTNGIVKAFASSKFASSEFGEVFRCESQRKLQRSLSQLIVALVVDGLLVTEIDAGNLDDGRLTVEPFQRGLRLLAPLVVAEVTKPGSHKELLGLLEPLNPEPLPMWSDAPTVPTPPPPPTAAEKTRVRVEAIRKFGRRLVSIAAEQVKAELADSSLGDDDSIRKTITEIVMAADLLDDKNRNNSLQIVGQLAPFVGVGLRPETIGFLVKPALRLAIDKARLVIEQTKRHKGWISDEVIFLQTLADSRIDEMNQLIESMNTTDDLTNIVSKLVTLYAGMILFGTEIDEKWQCLKCQSDSFINAANDAVKAKGAKTQVEEMERQLLKLVKAVDEIQGDESRKHVDVCVALYQAISAVHPQKTPPSKTCFTFFLSGVGLVSILVAISALTKTGHDPGSSASGLPKAVGEEQKTSS